MKPSQSILRSLKKKERKNVLVFTTQPELGYLSKIFMANHKFLIWSSGLPEIELECPENVGKMPNIPHIPSHINFDLAICTNAMLYANIKSLADSINLRCILLRYDYPPEGFILNNPENWNRVRSQTASSIVYVNDETKEKWGDEGIVLEFEDDSFIEKWEEKITKESEKIYLRT